MAIGHNGLRGCVIVIIFAVLRSSVSESNAAISGTAQQSSDYLNGRWPAEQAVDGCLQQTIASGCCSHTEAIGPKTAWWRVNLGTLITIDTITIYYRDNSQYRFGGYELYVSNTTSSPQDGALCFADTSTIAAAVQLIIAHQCPYVGRYVTVYNYRNNPKQYDWYDDFAVLELCEVQVWGCPVGTYGDGNCDSVCSGNCYGGNCNATTGACFYCIAQKHGVRCEHDCSIKCKDRLCDKATRHCYECVSGRYGATSEVNCGDGCKDKCEKVTGNCIECVAGKYGATCEVNCDDNCKDKCEKVTGNCTECIARKQGDKCDINCPMNCQECNKVTGQCTVCIAGRYGVRCTSTCPVTCKDFVCDKETGHCLECYPGKYGIVCGADCPESCKEGICNKEDGHCLTTDSPIVEHSSGDAKDTTITVLAVVCGLSVVIIVGIIVVVIYLRLKKEKQKNSTDKVTDQSDLDTGYTSIDQRQVDPPHIYEMAVTPHE